MKTRKLALAARLEEARSAPVDADTLRHWFVEGLQFMVRREADEASARLARVQTAFAAADGQPAREMEWMNDAFAAAAKIEVVRTALHLFHFDADGEPPRSYRQRLTDLAEYSQREVLNSVDYHTHGGDPCAR